MLNYPLTRKAKTQQRSTSQDMPLTIPQQFITPSPKHADVPFLPDDMVII